jgi:transposase-like protein
VAARAKNRQLPTAFKLKAIKRAEDGGGVLPVARKLGISRKLLHNWVKAWKAHGPEGLNRKRGPKPAPASSSPQGMISGRTYQSLEVAFLCSGKGLNWLARKISENP